MLPQVPLPRLRSLVERMRSARSPAQKTYMPTALLAVCDLAEQGKVHAGSVSAKDYKEAFQRLMLEVWPEREDFWFRPMLHAKKHGRWQTTLGGRDVPYTKRFSSFAEGRAAKAVDALRLDPDLAAALSAPATRTTLRHLVYQVLEQDAEERSARLIAVHQHLDPSQPTTDSLRDLLDYEHRMENRDAFEDLRQRQPGLRVVRPGQPQFRQSLLLAYANRCCMSGADAPPALEAAHILPFRGPHSHKIHNGLLLRRDLHTLFDDGLVTVTSPEDGTTFTIMLHPDLRRTVYREMEGLSLTLPAQPEHRPSREALQWHHRKNRGAVDQE